MADLTCRRRCESCGAEIDGGTWQGLATAGAFSTTSRKRFNDTMLREVRSARRYLDAAQSSHTSCAPTRCNGHLVRALGAPKTLRECAR